MFKPKAINKHFMRANKKNKVLDIVYYFFFHFELTIRDLFEMFVDIKLIFVPRL